MPGETIDALLTNVLRLIQSQTSSVAFGPATGMALTLISGVVLELAWDAAENGLALDDTFGAVQDIVQIDIFF